MFLAIIMFNLLINKTKKIFEDNSSINTLSKPVVPELLSGDPEYEAKKQELRETIYGNVIVTYCYHDYVSSQSFTTTQKGPLFYPGEIPTEDNY